MGVEVIMSTSHVSHSSDWLPDLLLLSESDGNWDRYLDRLYQAFYDDFVMSKPAYPGKRFALKRHPMTLEKETTFWHLIQKGPEEGAKSEDDRVPYLPRCERIRWPRPIVEAMGSGQVRVWKNVRGRNERIVIALIDFSYKVVLEDRGDFVMLWTAYPVLQTHGRQKLEKEYINWKSQNG